MEVIHIQTIASIERYLLKKIPRMNLTVSLDRIIVSASISRFGVS